VRPLTRIDPSGPAGAFQTYRIISPNDRAVRAACEQVGCGAWRHGWESKVDEGTALGQEQAAYIRQQSGRTFLELRTGEGLTVFRFMSGQRCFAEHRTRPETFLVRGGDWRQDLGRLRQHQNGADWVEDFGLHQDRLADQQRKG
jgi:hypothetical protein